MRLIRFLIILSLVFLPVPGRADGTVTVDVLHEAPQGGSLGEIVWEHMDTGFELGRLAIPLPEGKQGTLVLLRIDPANYVFKVYSRSAEEPGRSLRAWAKTHDLVAAINAGMYMPDGITHTGYLRAGDVVNNGRVAANLGVFFAAGPDVGELPEAVLLEKNTTDWKEIIPHYESVVQNYRMISYDRRIQWTQEGPAHAISAVGQEGDGNILFMHISEPLTCVDFTRMLLTVPLDIRTVMYVEGGSQAGMFLDAGNEPRVWTGQSTAGLWPVGGTPLPNIIGVKRR